MKRIQHAACETQAQAICMQTKDLALAHHDFAARQKPVFEGH